MNKKFLIVGPAWVGDMVMAQCLFKLLKANDPHAVIDVLAPAWSSALLARMPEVAESLVMPLQHGQLNLADRYRLGKSLRAKHYTDAIILPNSFKSALIPWWAKIPRRVGFQREMRFLLLNDGRFLDKKRYPLMIERFMALGLPAGSPLPKPHPLPELQISAETQAAALRRHQLAMPKNPVLALCPGAEFGPAKRWPPEYYAEIARTQLNQGWDVFIFGSPKDQDAADCIMQQTQNRAINLTGKTSLAEAVDLLALATLVISNDSGLMHIAAALKKPLLALYGPTSAAFTPPLYKEAKVLSLSLECQPCFQRTCPLKHGRCMRDLTPERVQTAIAEWGF